MKESVLNRVRKCSSPNCGRSYYIGIDGDDDRCDDCISQEELLERQLSADDGFGWRKGVKLEGVDDGTIVD